MELQLLLPLPRSCRWCWPCACCLQVPVDFIWWPDESDPGPYPIPPDAPVEKVREQALSLGMDYSFVRVW